MIFTDLYNFFQYSLLSFNNKLIINTLFIRKKIDQLNLNIKTAGPGINLSAIDKIFQIRVSNKKYKKLKGRI